MTDSTGKRPLITANMVTMARFLPMPLLCWWVYQNEIWPALILGTVIGCTDFVDGYLARKHGPTVLGGLLDPIADKVFIALAYLPFTDLGVIPAWAVALMFVRELVVTALRSAYEQRGLTMKTSYFGKVKTWIQMQGIGTLILFVLLWQNRVAMYTILIATIVAPLIAMAVFWAVKKRLWTGALLMGVLSVPLLLLYVYADLDLVVYAMILAVVAVTWLSGLDYILVGVRQLRGRGDFGRADAVRVIGAIALPCALFVALIETPMAAWPLATVLSVELAMGGLDNLLSHHHVAAGALAWSLRVLGASAVLFAAFAAARLGVAADSPYLIDGLGVVAAVITVAGVAREFWRGRTYYLTRHLRRESLDPSAA